MGAVTEAEFQSTYPRGVRRESFEAITKFMLFQSTYPRGVRPRSWNLLRMRSNFNPRTREGYDLLRRLPAFSFGNFNPRTREGYDYGKSSLQLRGQFQSTYPRGVRRRTGISYALCINISIHVPARGTTQQQSDQRNGWKNFNPRTREGYDAPYYL